jgi:hypothetical protein
MGRTESTATTAAAELITTEATASKAGSTGSESAKTIDPASEEFSNKATTTKDKQPTTTKAGETTIQ